MHAELRPGGSRAQCSRSLRDGVQQPGSGSVRGYTTCARSWRPWPGSRRRCTSFDEVPEERPSLVDRRSCGGVEVEVGHRKRQVTEDSREPAVVARKPASCLRFSETADVEPPSVFKRPVALKFFDGSCRPGVLPQRLVEPPGASTAQLEPPRPHRPPSRRSWRYTQYANPDVVSTSSYQDTNYTNG